MSVKVDAQDLAPVLDGMRAALDFQRRALISQWPDLEQAYEYADILSGGLHILECMSHGSAIADYWQSYGMEEYGDDKRLHYRRRVGEGVCDPLPSAPDYSELDGAHGPESRGRDYAEDRAIITALLHQGE